MFSLNIQNEIIYFEDVKLEHLPKVLDWYNKVDDFKFATGIDYPISLSTLAKKYAEVAICSNEFFVGIYLGREKKMVGILKGRIEQKTKFNVWISSIVIDPDYQHMGYGNAAINMLLQFLKKNNNIKTAYLAVIEENIQGKAFWLKQNFKDIRRIENYLKLQEKSQNIIIMSKQL